MGTSGAPTTIRLARGRSESVRSPAGLSLGTTRTGSFRANVLGARASLAATSACMCFQSAEAKASAGAPCSSCVRSSCEPAKAKATRVPGWSRSNLRPSSVNASRSEAAANTTNSRWPAARAGGTGTIRSSAMAVQSSRRMQRTSRSATSVAWKRHGVKQARRPRGLELADQLPGPAGVVALERAHLAAEGASLERLDDPPGARVAAPLLGEDEIEALFREGDEIEPVRDGRAARHHAGVGGAHGHRLRDLEVAAEQAVVSGHRGGGHPRLAQQPIEEAPRAGALLPVDEPDVLARDVFRLADAQRISAGNGESLLQVREGDDHHRPAAERPADERDVVFAGLLVEQVRAGDVRVAARGPPAPRRS